MDPLPYFPWKPDLPNGMNRSAKEPVGESASPANAKKAASRIGFGITFMLIADLSLSVLLLALVYLFTPEPSESLLMTISSLALYGFGIPMLYLVIKALPKKPPVKKEGSFGHCLGVFLLCIPLLYLGSYVGLYFSSFVEGIIGLPLQDNLTQTVDGLSLPLILLFTVILAPIFEELVFRKWILDRLAGFGYGPAIGFSGLVFGLYHGNFYQFFYAFALGCLFAYVYLTTGKLRCSVLMHMVINLTGAFLPSLITRVLGEESFAAGLFGTAILLAILAGIILWIVFLATGKLRLPPQEGALPEGKESCLFLNPGVIVFLLCMAGYFLLYLL